MHICKLICISHFLYWSLLVNWLLSEYIVLRKSLNNCLHFYKCSNKVMRINFCSIGFLSFHKLINFLIDLSSNQFCPANIRQTFHIFVRYWLWLEESWKLDLSNDPPECNSAIKDPTLWAFKYRCLGRKEVIRTTKPW